VPAPVDAGNDSGPVGTDSGASDSGGPVAEAGSSDSGTSQGDAAGGGGGGDTGGCGCRTVAPTRTSPWAMSGAFGLVLLGVARRRRRSR
jgi:MYXO-CTERM domain-containing protein